MITLTSSYFVTKNNLINDTLALNKAYSENLAKNLEKELLTMVDKLELASNEVSAVIDNKILLNNKLDDVLSKIEQFNAITVVDKEGIVLDTAPYLNIVGKKIATLGSSEALNKRKTIISEPFRSATNRPVILISTPLWSENHHYLGYLSGAIYLTEANILEKILGDHLASNGSYVSIVDEKGIQIYHPNKELIGTTAKEDEVYAQIMKHSSGAGKTKNVYGELFLSGYTQLPTSKWGIISQTPYEVSIHPLSGIVKKIFLYTIPFVVFFFLLTFFMAEKLSSPLRELSMIAKDMKGKKWNSDQFDHLPMWYFEAKQLNETIQEYAKSQQEKVDEYKERSYTDPLTKLKNRRYFDKISKRWLRNQNGFSVIMIDIDHFKEVNDTFGHQIGDEVLKFISKKMIEVVREKDLCIRLGGEEFMVLLFETELQNATSVAERLRQNISTVICPTQDYVTISAGVAEYQKGESIDDMYNRVDAALYQAKTGGRNRVVQAENIN